MEGSWGERSGVGVHRGRLRRGGGGCQRREGSVAVPDPYGLKDVLGWELGASEGGWWGCTNVGGDVGGGGQPLRTALHTISISLQNSFCESHTWRLVSLKALRAPNACWALSVYPVLEDRKSNGPDKKSVKRKFAYKRPTGIIQLLQFSLESKQKVFFCTELCSD